MTYARRLILALALSAGIAPALAQVPPPVPALPDTERRTAYTISASTCVCNVGFAIYGDGTDFANWIEVFVNGVLIPASGNWTITSPTGSLGSIPRPITDAVLTFTNAQTGTVQIVGARRPRRVSQFNENQGVPARNLNQALTDIIAQNRELWDKTNDITGRGLFSQPGNTIGLLPIPSLCANATLTFDATGLNPVCLIGAGSGNMLGPVTATAGHAAVYGATPNVLTDAGAAPALATTTISTTAPLTGGGTLAANRTFSLNIGTGLTTSGGNLILANPAASTIGGVQSLTCASHQWLNTIATTGLPACAQPAVSDLSGFGTGVATALGVNVGTAGSFVANGGALGSPSSAGTLPAFTLGGTVAGGGNQINNVIIGATTPLAGSFTTASLANGSANGLFFKNSGGSNDAQMYEGSGGIRVDILGAANAWEMTTNGAASVVTDYNVTTASTYTLTPNVAMAAGATIGNPTGGNKGPGTVNIAGAFYANGVAVSGTGTVTSVSCGAGLSGGTITGSGTCALALNSATLQASPANPTGATGTTVMMGLGSTCKLTPVFSTRIQLSFTGMVGGNSVVANNTYQARYGTGTAPSNGAAVAGTVLGQPTVQLNTSAGSFTLMHTTAIITGLTAGTAYWFDLSLLSGSGTGSLQSVSCTAMEF